MGLSCGCTSPAGSGRGAALQVAPPAAEVTETDLMEALLAAQDGVTLDGDTIRLTCGRSTSDVVPA